MAADKLCDDETIQPPSRAASAKASKVKGARNIDISSVGHDTLHMNRAQMNFQLGECTIKFLGSDSQGLTEDTLQLHQQQRQFALARFLKGGAIGVQLNTLWLTKNSLTYFWNYMMQDSTTSPVGRLELLWPAWELSDQGARVFNGMGLEGATLCSLQLKLTTAMISTANQAGDSLGQAQIGALDSAKAGKHDPVLSKLIELGDDASRRAASFITAGVAAKTLLTGMDQLVDHLSLLAAKADYPLECHSKDLHIKAIYQVHLFAHNKDAATSEALQALAEDLDNCKAHALPEGGKSHTFAKPLRARLWCSLAFVAEAQAQLDLAIRAGQLVLALVKAIAKNASSGIQSFLATIECSAHVVLARALFRQAQHRFLPDFELDGEGKTCGPTPIRGSAHIKLLLTPLAHSANACLTAVKLGSGAYMQPALNALEMVAQALSASAAARMAVLPELVKVLVKAVPAQQYLTVRCPTFNTTCVRLVRMAVTCLADQEQWRDAVDLLTLTLTHIRGPITNQLLQLKVVYLVKQGADVERDVYKLRNETASVRAGIWQLLSRIEQDSTRKIGYLGKAIGILEEEADSGSEVLSVRLALLQTQVNARAIDCPSARQAVLDLCSNTDDISAFELLECHLMAAQLSTTLAESDAGFKEVSQLCRDIFAEVCQNASVPNPSGSSPADVEINMPRLAREWFGFPFEKAADAAKSHFADTIGSRTQFLTRLMTHLDRCILHCHFESAITCAGLVCLIAHTEDNMTVQGLAMLYLARIAIVFGIDVDNVDVAIARVLQGQTYLWNVFERRGSMTLGDPSRWEASVFRTYIRAAELCADLGYTTHAIKLVAECQQLEDQLDEVARLRVAAVRVHCGEHHTVSFELQSCHSAIEPLLALITLRDAVTLYDVVLNGQCAISEYPEAVDGVLLEAVVADIGAATQHRLDSVVIDRKNVSTGCRIQAIVALVAHSWNCNCTTSSLRAWVADPLQSDLTSDVILMHFSLLDTALHITAEAVDDRLDSYEQQGDLLGLQDLQTLEMILHGQVRLLYARCLLRLHKAYVHTLKTKEARTRSKIDPEDKVAAFVQPGEEAWSEADARLMGLTQTSPDLCATHLSAVLNLYDGHPQYDRPRDVIAMHQAQALLSAMSSKLVSKGHLPTDSDIDLSEEDSEHGATIVEAVAKSIEQVFSKWDYTTCIDDVCELAFEAACLAQYIKPDLASTLLLVHHSGSAQTTALNDYRSRLISGLEYECIKRWQAAATAPVLMMHADKHAACLRTIASLHQLSPVWMRCAVGKDFWRDAISHSLHGRVSFICLGVQEGLMYAAGGQTTKSFGVSIMPHDGQQLKDLQSKLAQVHQAMNMQAEDLECNIDTEADLAAISDLHAQAFDGLFAKLNLSSIEPDAVLALFAEPGIHHVLFPSLLPRLTTMCILRDLSMWMSAQRSAAAFAETTSEVTIKEPKKDKKSSKGKQSTSSGDIKLIEGRTSCVVAELTSELKETNHRDRWAHATKGLLSNSTNTVFFQDPNLPDLARACASSDIHIAFGPLTPHQAQDLKFIPKADVCINAHTVVAKTPPALPRPMREPIAVAQDTLMAHLALAGSFGALTAVGFRHPRNCTQTADALREVLTLYKKEPVAAMLREPIMHDESAEASEATDQHLETRDSSQKHDWFWKDALVVFGLGSTQLK
eukprot:TRINITY_DN12284_c0_g1_i1.p1 TRINITY_DN12284_c0_g1~~TRINITY_DN12284_c0_g1_i1.p1  ORF type:complete len:1745 (+),score=277.44 TRINITY_DN12284_c0_g1_i1:226-5235(+)